MCNQFTLHREFRIDTRRTKFEQGQTDSILHVCGSNEQRTQRSCFIDLEAPRLACYKQKTWKEHQNTVYWVDIKLAQKKGLKFYQTRSNAIVFYDTLPAYCIPRAVMVGSGEVICEKVCAPPLPPLKIYFKDNWMKYLGSEVAGGWKDSQKTQPKTKHPMVKHGETCENLCASVF